MLANDNFAIFNLPTNDMSKGSVSVEEYNKLLARIDVLEAASVQTRIDILSQQPGQKDTLKSLETKQAAQLTLASHIIPLTQLKSRQDAFDGECAWADMLVVYRKDLIAAAPCVNCTDRCSRIEYRDLRTHTIWSVHAAFTHTNNAL